MQNVNLVRETNGHRKAIRISVVHARAMLGKLLDRVADGQWVVIERGRQPVGVIISLEDLAALSNKATQRIDGAEEARFNLP